MKPCVLFVDDDKRIINAIRRSVRQEEWDKLFAYSGEEALDLMAANPVAVLVTDLSMPGMSGQKLMKQVKEKYPEVVAIALTGVNELADVYEVFCEVEPFKYVTKPWEEDVLKTVILQAIEEWHRVSGCKKP